MPDKLQELIDIARRECPEIPEAALARMVRAIRWNLGTRTLYVPALRKRIQLDALDEASQEASSEEIAKKLGVSVRTARRLKRMRKG